MTGDELVERSERTAIHIFPGTQLRRDPFYDLHPDPSGIAWINNERKRSGLYPIDRFGRIRHDKAFGERDCPDSDSVWAWMNAEGRIREDGTFDFSGMPSY